MVKTPPLKGVRGMSLRSRHCGYQPQSPVNTGDSDFRQNDGMCDETTPSNFQFSILNYIWHV